MALSDNPMLKAAIQAIVQHTVTKGLSFLVTYGVWKATDANVYETALSAVATVWLLDTAVSWVLKHKSEILERVALALPHGSTKQDVTANVAAGNVPAPTASNVAPTLPQPPITGSK